MTRQYLPTLTIQYKKVEQGWFQAQILEMPTVITAAPTMNQAREGVLDALSQTLLAFVPDNPRGMLRPDAEETITTRVSVVGKMRE